MVRLQVYVSNDCWSCAESRRLVGAVAPQFPEVAIELLNVDGCALPEPVFAVPTFVLNGRIVSLGNPTLGELRMVLQHALHLANT